MPQSYGSITLAQFRAKLLQRLGQQTTGAFWLDSELNLYIDEALRAFNAGCQFHRARITFDTTANQAIYDIADIPISDPTLVERSYLSSSLIPTLKYQLMESQTAGVWSEQFSPIAVTNSMNAGQNQFQLDTGMIVTHVPNFAVPNLGSGRVLLGDSTIDVRRVVWVDSSGQYTYLWRNDEMQINALSTAQFYDSSVPQEFSLATIRNTQLQLYPAPLDAGQLDLMLIESGPVLDPDNLSSVVNVVNDFGDMLKYKIEADLLGQDGPGKDPARSAYCLSRYNDYVVMAKAWPTVIQGFIGERPVFVQSINDFDIYKPTWQQVSGAPTDIAIANNLICIAPIPDGVYGITLDIICNSPLPTDDTSFIQIPFEALEDVIGYAAHIAMFKLESPEFDLSMPLYKNFINLCVTYNAKLRADDFDLLIDRGMTHEEERQVPRRKTA